MPPDPPPSTHPRFILVGDDTLTIECGRRALERGWVLSAVVTSEPRVSAWAASAAGGVPIRSHGPGLAPAVPETDFILSIANLRVLAADVLARAARGAVNFHDGPLPERAGLNAPVWAILERAERYGITWHAMLPAVDRGPVVKSVGFDLAPNETAVSLNTRCFEAALESFDAVLDELEAHGVSRAEPATGPFRASRRHDRPELGGVLDPARPAEDLVALVRALDFGRYDNPVASAKALLDDRAVVVTDAEVEDGRLRLRAAETLTGEPLSEPDVARLTLTAPPPHLADAVRRAAPHEAVWTRTLEAFEPTSAPLVPRPAGRPSGIEPGETDATRETVGTVGTVGTVERATDASVDTCLAALAALLWRLGDANAIGLTVTGGFDAGGSGAAFDARLYDHRIPLTLDVTAISTRAALGTHVAARLEILRQRGPWPRDLVARSSALRGRGDAARAPIVFARGTKPPAVPGDDLTLHLDAGTLRATFDAARFDRADVERFLDAVLTIARAPESQPIGDIDLLEPTERAAILGAWNDTERPPHPAPTIHAAIIAALERRPEADAVVAADGRRTGRDLLDRSAALARALVRAGIRAGDRVGIATARTTDLVVAVLGVLRAGAAYVPLDPAYPVERRRFMREDAGTRIVIGDDVDALIAAGDGFTAGPEAGFGEDGIDAGAPSDAAYLIYTSGSTGQPKGVVVEHGNVLNFFVGMDERIPAREGDALLAVTSLSFDISVLELLWTLARGMKVVLHDDDAERTAIPAPRPDADVTLSLYFWGNDDGPGARKYELLLDAARFADAHGFEAIWTPERHFHAFGGPYPNPSVMSAAIAAITTQLQIRAGSCVVPLHHPLRVAEEWAVVDNLSNGRVGVSFASGWQADDFVLRPEAYADRKEGMFRTVDTVQRLWRGETVAFDGPNGSRVERTTLPRPVQAELPTWITAAGSPETFKRAGTIGANMLTHLLGQSVAEVAEKVRLYRDARAEAGHDPATGRVTLMLHTFVGEDAGAVRDIVRGPLKAYLASATALLAKDAWAFPAFKRPEGAAAGAAAPEIDLAALSAEEMDALLDHAFERYFETSGLFGTVDDALAMIARCADAGVDEVACLVDFGIEPAVVREMLPALGRVQKRVGGSGEPAPETAAPHRSFAAAVSAENVSHLQCTPTQMRLLLADDDTRDALGHLSQLMIGGEPFPPRLRADLGAIRAGVTNMYGPTETTIWSTTAPIDLASTEAISIGTPIANTKTWVLDRTGSFVPPGLPGQLWIGGAGVARGYHGRTQLTEQRFRPDPFAPEVESRMYDTGDGARWRRDGALECLGRGDGQVKLRGNRIELGEVEAAISRCASVSAAAAFTLGDTLAAAIVGACDPNDLAAELGGMMPGPLVPTRFVMVDALPVTPNGKLDRRRLPAIAAPHNSCPAAPADGPLGDIDPIAATIRSIWRDLLGHDGFGLDDDFFGLGGHSLSVIALTTRIHEDYGVRVPLQTVFHEPTVKGLARFVESRLLEETDEATLVALLDEDAGT